jgi:hypothetical protein
MKKEYESVIKEKYEELLEIVSDESNYNTKAYRASKNCALGIKLYKEMLKNIYEGKCFITTLKSSKSYGRVYDKYRNVSYLDKEERVFWNLNNNYSMALTLGEIPLLESDEIRWYVVCYLNQNGNNYRELFKEFIDLNFKAKNKISKEENLKSLEYQKEIVKPKIENVIDSYITKKVRDRKINSLFI